MLRNYVETKSKRYRLGQNDNQKYAREPVNQSSLGSFVLLVISNSAFY